MTSFQNIAGKKVFSEIKLTSAVLVRCTRYWKVQKIKKKRAASSVKDR